LAAGSYTVTAARSGYTFTPASRSVALTGNVTGIDFTATLNTYSLSGTVRQGASGLSGVTVTAGVKSATTDSSGRYTISGLAAGTYTVTPLASGYSFSPASAIVTLTSNQSGVDFVTTTTTYRITGRITQGGSGLAGIAVAVGSTTVTTDAGGNYAATGLQPGKYAVQPSGTGLQFSPTSRVITVGPDRSSADFTAVSLLQISGRITLNGAGMAGITVSAGVRSATTDADGAYSMSDVPSGTYTLTPAGGGNLFDPASRTVTLTGSNVSGVDFSVVTDPRLVSLEPTSTSLRGGKSTAVLVRFDRAVTAKTYVSLTSSAAQGKVPKRVLLKKGRTSASFTLTTRTVKQELVLTITGTANGVVKTTVVTLLPKASARR
jgi:inhibitor of cysteine peptidase